MKHLAIGVCTLVLLSACGQRPSPVATGEGPPGVVASTDAGPLNDAKEAAANAAAMAQAEQAEAVAAAASARRAAQYKRALLPLIVGSYSGACVNSAGAKTDAAITISASGMVSAEGVTSRDLMAAGAMVSVGQKATGGMAQGLVFVGGDDGWSVAVEPSPEQKVVFGDKQGGVHCVSASATPPAPVKRLFPLVASYFIAAARSMNCTDMTALPKSVAIKPGPDGVTIGEEKFSFVAPDAGEQLIVATGDLTLNYLVEEPDGGTVGMQLGPTGSIDSLTVVGRPGKKNYICTPQVQ